MTDATNPAASGPAGGHFEGQVGASYLLSMLVGAEARGLPGAIIDRVAFQRAAEGHPLDDVIVYAHDRPPVWLPHSAQYVYRRPHFRADLFPAKCKWLRRVERLWLHYRWPVCDLFVA